jgi:hypothetical protein
MRFFKALRKRRQMAGLRGANDNKPRDSIVPGARTIPWAALPRQFAEELSFADKSIIEEKPSRRLPFLHRQKHHDLRKIGR